MNNNDIIKHNNGIFRVLGITESKVFVVDCIKQRMPFYIQIEEISNIEFLSENVLPKIRDASEISPAEQAIINKRFSMIASSVFAVEDTRARNKYIANSSMLFNVSKQTLRHYLWLYLVYQNICALAPADKTKSKELSSNERNIRWALNKFYYSRNKNSLTTAYTLMLKEKYCDEFGQLLSDYPSYHQFRYFYRKNKD